ncbi:hypothetical protein Tco_0111548 [Tanacetum coccineum]
MISLLRNKPGMKEEDVATLCGMDASPGPSTPQKISGMTECSNCKFLAERIKTLEARISVLEMARHPENHTLESAGILHEIYQGMRNLNME